MRANRLHHIQPFLVRIEPNFVGSEEAIGHHAHAILVDKPDIAIGNALAAGSGPRILTCSDRKPQPATSVAQYEVGLPQRASIQGVEHNLITAVTAEVLQP